jgi:F-box/leucine-rich repeat protein 2/20
MRPLATGCCPNLARLSLNFCNNITEGALAAIAVGCKRLTEISIIGGNITGCPIVEGCLDLAKLNLDRTSASNIGLYRIASRAKRLKELSLDGCIHVSDEGVKAVLAGCKNLTWISLYGTEVSKEERAVAKAITNERRQLEG